MKKRVLFLSLLSLVFIAGCGENSFEGQEDKNSTEAQQFDISAQLDAGNYGEILAHPEDVNATDYAAAAMGEAGLDPVSLIQAMNEVSRCAQTPTPADCTTTTTDDLGTVTNIPLDAAALDELQTAKDKLAAELDCPNGPKCNDPDLNFQMTLTSLTSTLTALAEVGENPNNGIAYTDPLDNQTKSFNASDGISKEEATALGSYISTNGDQPVSVDVKDVNGNDLPDTLANLIATDVANVVNTLPSANLGTGSDLNTVLNDATQGSGSINHDGIGTVSATDISNYLNLVLGI